MKPFYVALRYIITKSSNVLCCFDFTAGTEKSRHRVIQAKLNKNGNRVKTTDLELVSGISLLLSSTSQPLSDRQWIGELETRDTKPQRSPPCNYLRAQLITQSASPDVSPFTQTWAVVSNPSFFCIPGSTSIYLISCPINIQESHNI